ncbi:MAG: ATP-binding protein [Terriglobales bacterium]
MPDKDKNRSTRLDTASRYALATAAAIFGLVLRLWLTPFFGDRNRFHTAWAAVAFCAWYCGLGPSIVAAIVSALGIWFWFDAPDRSQIGLYRVEMWGTFGFLLFSALIISFGEAARRSKARAERTERSLRESEAQLKQFNQNMAREIEQRTSELEQKTDQTVAQANLLNLANDAILVRDASGRISYWNQGAERLYGWTKEEAVGKPAHELLRTVFPVALAEIAESERWEGELFQVKRDCSAIAVAARWTALRDHDGRFKGWLEISTDITGRKLLEDAARRLTGRILSLQDDERRRIARELHDSLGQYLASIKINLDLLSRTMIETEQGAILSDCLSATEQCLTETRTISHLLHPPLLDEAGFTSAARWYVEGFAQRSGFEVKLDLPEQLGRLDRDVETALFRVLQEALTNVHRHSGASAARVLVRIGGGQVQLEITDNGKGIPPDRLYHLQNDGSGTGVGLAGMRERARELGGSLRVVSAFPGTTVILAIPLDHHGSQQPEESSRDASAA